MVLAISLLLQNFGVNGFTEAVIQREEINHKQISTLFWINVCFSVMLALLFIASSSVIVWFYKEPRLKLIVMAISGSIILSGLSTQHLALLMRKMEFYKISVNGAVAAVISVTISIFLAWRGWGYWALVAKWVVSPLAVTAGGWVLCRWRPGLPSGGAGVGPMVRFAGNTYGNFVVSYFSRNLDRILIGRFLGAAPLGYYDRAYHLSNVLPNQITSPLNGVAISAFSRLTAEPEKYRKNFFCVLSILAFFGMPLSAALTLISEDLIFLLLGPQWHIAGHIFFAFGPSIGVGVLYITHGWLHVSLGTPDRWFRWGIIGLIVTASCFAAGLSYGVIGVAVAYTVSTYVLIGPALWYAGKPINLKLSSVLSAVWKYYVAAVGAGLFCWFVLYSYELTSNIFISFNIIARILISVVLCLCIYLALIVAMYQGVKPITQFISVLREMIPRRFPGE
jgi:PST family polysaccharide transporter